MRIFPWFLLAITFISSSARAELNILVCQIGKKDLFLDLDDKDDYSNVPYRLLIERKWQWAEPYKLIVFVDEDGNVEAADFDSFYANTSEELFNGVVVDKCEHAVFDKKEFAHVFVFDIARLPAFDAYHFPRASRHTCRYAGSVQKDCIGTPFDPAAKRPFHFHDDNFKHVRVTRNKIAEAGLVPLIDLLTREPAAPASETRPHAEVDPESSPLACNEVKRALYRRTQSFDSHPFPKHGDREILERAETP